MEGLKGKLSTAAMLPTRGAWVEVSWHGDTAHLVRSYP